MAWNIGGEWLEVCSCKMVCPCNFGPAEPDRGWCSGAFVLDIRQGKSDGVDLSGTRVAMALDLPGDFVSGNATARVYIDERASAEQRRELEAIMGGQKGGIPAGLAGMVTKGLATQTAKIEYTSGDNASASVGNVGSLKAQRIKTEDGKQATVLNAPLAAGMGANEIALANATRDSKWTDPEMRSWESGGYGGVVAFNWSA